MFCWLWKIFRLKGVLQKRRLLHFRRKYSKCESYFEKFQHILSKHPQHFGVPRHKEVARPERNTTSLLSENLSKFLNVLMKNEQNKRLQSLSSTIKLSRRRAEILLDLNLSKMSAIRYSYFTFKCWMKKKRFSNIMCNIRMSEVYGISSIAAANVFLTVENRSFNRSPTEASSIAIASKISILRILPPQSLTYPKQTSPTNWCPLT